MCILPLIHFRPEESTSVSAEILGASPHQTRNYRPTIANPEQKWICITRMEWLPKCWKTNW